MQPKENQISQIYVSSGETSSKASPVGKTVTILSHLLILRRENDSRLTKLQLVKVGLSRTTSSHLTEVRDGDLIE